MEAIQSPVIAFAVAYGLEAFRKGQLFSSAALGNGLQIGVSVWLGRIIARQTTAPSLDLVSTRQITTDAAAGVVYALLRKMWGETGVDDFGNVVSLENFGRNFGYGFGVSVVSSLVAPAVMPGLASFANLRMNQVEVNTWNTFDTGDLLPSFNPGCGTTALTQYSCLWPSTRYSMFG